MIEQFCKSILRIVTRNSKAFANLVMGLASQRGAKSVVELSLSRSYHYQYSSISKSIKALDKEFKKAKDKELPKVLSRQEVEKKFTNQGASFTKTL